MTLFLASSYFSQAQFLHTPEELEEIVNNNPDKYLLQETENLSPEAFENCRCGTEKHNEQDISGLESSIFSQNLNKSAKKKLKKKNKKIIKRVNQNEGAVDLISELCENHFKLGNFNEALKYKQLLPKSEKRNFEDEYFLAKSYLETNQFDLALDHALNAKIKLPYRNKNVGERGKKMVENLLSETLNAQKKAYQDWTLQFSYCITNRDNKTYISFKSEPWKTYAICKSVWQEDPEHKTKMATISDQDSWMVEEKECLLNTLVAYMRHEDENSESKGLDHLALSLDENTVKEFIIYEKFVAKYKAIPKGIPSKKEIEKLKAYFLRAHSTDL